MPIVARSAEALHTTPPYSALSRIWGGALLAGCGAPERDGTRPNLAIQFKKFMSRVESGLTRGVVKRKTDAEATSLNRSMQPGSFLSEPHAGYKSEPVESTQGLIEER